MKTTSSAHPAGAPNGNGTLPSNSFRTRWPIGDLISRVVVPLWVSAGALMKLAERDPRLLPEPIVDIVAKTAVAYMETRNHAWLLDTTLRWLIGIELALVVGMVLAPRISRLLAGFTLVVFLVVLAETMRRQVISDGFMAMLSGNCGCLGKNSPPPPIMFLIDLVLLVGVILFPLRCSLGAASTRLVPLGLVFGSIAGFTLAFMTPPKTMIIVIPPDHDDDPMVVTTDGTAPADSARPTAREAAPHWPAPPEVLPMYWEQAETWVGKRMSELDLLRQMRPAPAPQLLEGITYVVVYRGDCGNCHELLERHFTGDRAPRTIALRVGEGDPAADKPMPSERLRMHALPIGPTYVFTTPLLAIARDGVIRAAAAGVDNATALSMLESIEAEAPAPPAAAPDPARDREAAAPPPARPAPPAEAPSATRAWPARPEVEGLYFPQFEEWVGTRLDAHPLALQINRPMPVNEGRWHVIFYRADCDVCHEMMDIYLVGEFEHRVIAVRIPDTDPSGDLPMPLTGAVRRSLPQGPTYVIQTPVLLTVQDGMVLCMATDPRDPDSVIGCLDAE